MSRIAIRLSILTAQAFDRLEHLQLVDLSSGLLRHVRFRVDHDDGGHVCEIQHRDLNRVARALDGCPSQRTVVSCWSLPWHCYTFKSHDLSSLLFDVQLSNFSYFVSDHGRAI